MIERSYRSHKEATEPNVRLHLPKFPRPALYGLVAICVVVIAVWFASQRLAYSDKEPFTPGVLAAMKFPLYYPAKLPSGYHIDAKSVTTPHPGVVVFSLVSSSGSQIWFSEEARPASFNLGGFYDNLQNAQKFGVSDGSIAVGFYNSTEIASRATNQTWLLCNTKAKVPVSQMVAMLKSIRLAS